MPYRTPATTRPSPGAAARGDHRVAFDDGTEELTDAVVAFLQPALTEGVAVVVAKPGHRQRIGAALIAAGMRAPGTQDGHLIALDAAATLEQLMVDGVPDRDRFDRLIGGLLADAARSGGPVRVYGEMVALLWEQGDVAGAMALEDLWNELAEAHQFGLLCGYPSALFAHPDAADDIAALCDQHTAVALRPSSAPGARWQLPADVTSGAQARSHLRQLLESWRLAHLLDAAELLASELINNAVVHALSPVTVDIRRRDDAVRVEVTDVGSGVPRKPDAGLEASHGRGLMLVEALSDAWGTTVDDGRKTVWFELRAPAA